MKMFALRENKKKSLSIEFLILLILLLVIKTINASTLPAMALNELPQTNKCEQIAITQHCPELKYNRTMVSNFAHGHQMDINDANEMVRGFLSVHYLKLLELVTAHTSSGLSRPRQMSDSPYLSPPLPVNSLLARSRRQQSIGKKQTKAFVNDSARRMEKENERKNVMLN